MNIRLAKPEDLKEIQNIYDVAKSFMREQGNTKQWVNGYPSDEILLKDIANNNLYVVEEEEIKAVFALIYGDDPTYSYIEGKWLNNNPYGTIHRIASKKEFKDTLKIVTEFALLKTNDVRIDTHEDNVVMRHVVLKNGYKYCGVIYLANGDPRLAYQLSV